MFHDDIRPKPKWKLRKRKKKQMDGRSNEKKKERKKETINSSGDPKLLRKERVGETVEAGTVRCANAAHTKRTDRNCGEGAHAVEVSERVGEVERA